MSGVCDAYSDATWSITFICFHLLVGLLANFSIKGYPISLYPSFTTAATLFAVVLNIGLAATSSVNDAPGDFVQAGVRFQGAASLYAVFVLTYDITYRESSSHERLNRALITVLLGACGLLFVQGPVGEIAASVGSFSLAFCLVYTAVSWKVGRKVVRGSAWEDKYTPEVSLIVGACFSAAAGSVQTVVSTNCSDSDVLLVGTLLYGFLASVALLQAQVAITLTSGVVTGIDPTLHNPNWSSLFYVRIRGHTERDEGRFALEQADVDHAPEVFRTNEDQKNVQQERWELADLGCTEDI